MKFSTRKLASLVAAVVLLATVAAAASAPVLAAPPEGKGKPGGDTGFTIKADLWSMFESSVWDGDFTATGAVKDTGHADLMWDSEPEGYWLDLQGKQGDMLIFIELDDTFYVVSGTRKYETLSAVGSARWGKIRRRHYEYRLHLTLDATVLSW